MTNPPFGSDIPITEKTILEQYELARRWERQGDGFVMTNAIKPAVSPEVLFIERCVKWLKPGGRAGIVLPDGILGNPGDEYIRYWILRHCWVLASIMLKDFLDGGLSIGHFKVNFPRTWEFGNHFFDQTR